MGTPTIKLARAIRDLKRIKDIQGTDGNWNTSPYMKGVFNGIELAMAVMQDRQPNYKVAEIPVVEAEDSELHIKLERTVMGAKLKDLSGKKVGLLSVIDRSEDTFDGDGTQRVQWNCVCECGAKVVKIARYLLRGSAGSCGGVECKKRLKDFAKEYRERGGIEG